MTLVGAEVHLPYDRPPLSKKLLAGDWEPDRIALRKPDEYDHLDLDLRLGVAATGLDVDGRVVHLADGTTVSYGDGVIIATGTATKRLPGQEAVPTVHELRTIEDSLALRDRSPTAAAARGRGRRRVHRPRGRRDRSRPGVHRDGAGGAPGTADPRARRRRWGRRRLRSTPPTASTSAAA